VTRNCTSGCRTAAGEQGREPANSLEREMRAAQYDKVERQAVRRGQLAPRLAQPMERHLDLLAGRRP